MEKSEELCRLGILESLKLQNFGCKTELLMMVYQDNFLGKGVAFPKETSCTNVCV